MRIPVTRLCEQPVISAHTDSRIGPNINGPCLVHSPDWVTAPQAPRAPYYLYFAAHRGTGIYLAYANHVQGPWRLYGPGVLDLARSGFPQAHEIEAGQTATDEPYLYAHIASPDVQVLRERQEVRLYYHGLCPQNEQGEQGEQATRVALSRDGLNFLAQPHIVGPAYLRTFPVNGAWYAIAMPGMLMYSRDGLEPFVHIGDVLPAEARHCAVLCEEHCLHVVWSNVGEGPERLYHGTMDLRDAPARWTVSGQQEILRPERTWEGADCPVVPSVYGAADTRVNELRDPYLFRDGANIYLLYAGGGESAIGLASFKNCNLTY